MSRLALAVDASHPAFAGHFPSRPVVPGVVLLDESLRAIAANFGVRNTIAAAICRIDVAKFLSPIAPGEALRLEVEPKPGPAVTTGTSSARYAFSVFAGVQANERLAMTGTVSFEPRVACESV